jgi:hypothetical protein
MTCHAVSTGLPGVTNALALLRLRVDTLMVDGYRIEPLTMATWDALRGPCRPHCFSATAQLDRHWLPGLRRCFTAQTRTIRPRLTLRSTSRPSSHIASSTSASPSRISWASPSGWPTATCDRSSTPPCFLTSRALEQIKNAACTGANVVFCGFVSGLAYGALGGTHHAVEDIAWMRAIPRMTVLSRRPRHDQRCRTGPQRWSGDTLRRGVLDVVVLDGVVA